MFLDKLVLDKDDREKKNKGLSFYLLLESLKHIWRSRYQKLLVPLTIYSGIEQAFIAGDFTRVSLIVSCFLIDGFFNLMRAGLSCMLPCSLMVFYHLLYK